MFGGWISFYCSGLFWNINGPLNSEKITILENGLVPSANALFEENNYLLQQVNYPGHFRITNATGQRRFKGLPWWLRSPDINPIKKHICDNSLQYTFMTNNAEILCHKIDNDYNN